MARTTFKPLIYANRLVIPATPLHTPERLMTASQLAAHFRLHRNVVRAWTDRVGFPRPILVANGAVYALDEVMQWLKSRG